MRLTLTLITFLFFSAAYSQKAEDYINATEANRIISFLASDSLKGRRNMTPEIGKAANFIANRFQKDSLQFFAFYNTYFQPFFGPDVHEQLESITVNGKEIPSSNYLLSSPYLFPPTLTLQQFRILQFDAYTKPETILDSLTALKEVNTPILIQVADNNLIQYLKKPFSKLPAAAEIRLIISSTEVQQLTFEFRPQTKKKLMYNVLGFLPGKTHPEEIVMITAHYDHVGTAANGAIYYGANDNASGTTSMLMLADYFAANRNNDRSILFVAFAGEELGLYGSSYLASIINPESVVALINLEMLGKPSKQDKLSCIVTGDGSLPQYFRKEVKSIKVRYDDNVNANLFKRSDNYPFALRKVPAHTFIIFDPNDPDYHQPTDDIQTLDLENMCAIVKGLLPAIQKIVAREFTPKRLSL